MKPIGTNTHGSVGPYFGLPNAPCLRLTPVHVAPFSVTRIQRAASDRENVTVDLPPQNAYFVMLYLRDVRHRDILADGSRTDVSLYRKGSICLVDLACGASICLHSELDSLAFNLPRSLFQEVIATSPEAKLQELRCKRGEFDPVMRNLGVALLPLFERSLVETPAALQYIAVAICAHLLHHYVEVPPRDHPSTKSSLSVWQEKAAKEFMIDHIGSDISVAAIAASAGLSSSHFSQRFKDATGLTPHQWLLKMRVAQAKELLADRSMNLSEIAAKCGFADQSHFTKVFVREAGTTPAAWRNRSLQ